MKGDFIIGGLKILINLSIVNKIADDSMNG